MLDGGVLAITAFDVLAIVSAIYLAGRLMRLVAMRLIGGSGNAPHKAKKGL